MRKVLSDKKTIITVLSIILVLTIMSSTTYAIFFRVNTFENTESYTAGVLDIEVEEGSTLSLANTLPITDSEGASLTPYTFTVKNVGNLTYTFDLKMLSTTSSNPINSSYIKVKLDDNEPVLLSSLTNGIIGSDIRLNPGESITMSIRIWLDINTPNTEIGKSFSAKIVTDGIGSEYVMTGADYITSLVSSNPDTMNNDDPDGNVRYMGADPNNYVSFNNELWRIIGVFDVASTYGGLTEKRLKIIRDEPIGNYSWNNKPSGTGSSDSSSGINDWTDSALMEVLNNGAYWNRSSGTCPSGSNGATTSCDFSSTGLTEEAKTLIGDAVWNLGGTASYTSASNGLPSHFYGYERGETVYTGPTYWVGKIGLMYPSDYGYATSGGTTTNRDSCLAKEMYNWSSSSYSYCKNNDYLYDSSLYQWTITPHSSSSSNVFTVDATGYVKSFRALWPYATRPVLYLASTVEITGGEGSQSKPYTLDMPSVPATETISNIYNNAEKTTVANNGVNYEYATSVGMMEDVGGNIRYYGEDPNNYVSFNNELWRIIGVFNDIDDGNGNKETRIKIARNESIGNYQWDNNENEWSTSTLQTYLNGTYLNSLTSEAQEMIGNAKWNLGGSSTYQGLYANDYYTFERGTAVYSGRNTEWTGEIALMYPSDYMYAGDLSKCSKDGYNWDTDKTNCRDTSWLRNTSTVQLTITPSSSSSIGVFSVYDYGHVDGSDFYDVTNYNASRPVLYLASTVEITGGEGTSENPFTLSQ